MAEASLRTDCAVITMAATPHAGKTSLIMALVDALRDQLNMAVVLGTDASAADCEKFEATGIPAVLEGNGASWTVALDGLNTDRLDLIIAEVAWGGGEEADALLLSAGEAREALEALADAAEAKAVVVNKWDTVTRLGAGAAALKDSLESSAPKAQFFFTSATTGAGIEPLAQWVLERLNLASWARGSVSA